ncbi:MAG: hypothetical protein KF764_27380 [Labilithrix sp.]|nr:hypothetical protein [Labilithrix sp.]
MVSLPKSLAHALVLTVVAASAAGCVNDEESAKADGTMKSDGYALFAVENSRQQRNDVTVTVRDADAGATYVLLYSEGAPRNVGWFLFDPNARSRCGGSTGPHCEVAGFGYMVDVVKVAEGSTEVVLRDERCGCDADSDEKSWTGHWAVMRVERTDRTNAVTFDVRALKVSGYASEPKIDQLQ